MWQVLGIAATDDPVAIRRAYAARLKALDPDRDPEEFWALRRAYESALARARHSARSPVPPPPQVPDAESNGGNAAENESENASGSDGNLVNTSELERDPVDSAAVRAPTETDMLLANAQAESGAALGRFRGALSERDWSAAARELVSASARGLLPLANEEAHAAEVMKGAMADRDLSAASFRAVAQQLHWDGPLTWSRGAHDKLRQQVWARIDAENWYTALLEQASYRPPGGLNLHGWLGGDPKQIERGAAMMVLGYTSANNARRLKKWLDPLLVQAEQHQPWLGNRIDPCVIETLRDRLIPPPKAKSGASWIWIFIAIALLQVLLALANKN
ncbi:MAG TPA: hypothetical protein VLX09_20415 [Stellaceae bacterium]|nr:hypothetical protein [Stellaceae bacterium]